MRKYTTLFLLMLCCTVWTNAQITIALSGQDIDAGDSVQVDVKVSDFTNIFGGQFSVNWDSLVLEYAEITNVISSSQLQGFDINAIGTPPGSANIDNGEITVSWFSSTTQTLPDDTRLFSLVLRGIGMPCDSTDIAVTGTPLAIEIYDENFNDIGADSDPIEVKINGVDCSGGGGTGLLTFTINNRNVQPGENICIPILMENFNGYNAGQGKLSWDPAVLDFTMIQNPIAGSFVDNTTQVDNGLYNFIWENLDPANPVSLPDGTALFEMCFTVVGSLGDMTVMDMTSFAADWGFTDATGQEPPLVLDNGKITVAIAQDPVVLIIGDITLDEGGNACAPVSVENFVDIVSFQGTFTWNASVIAYDTVSGFGQISGLGPEDFNHISSNRLRVTWNTSNGNPVTVPDGTVIFNICFDGVGPCEQMPTSLINFIDVSGFEIEFVKLSGGSPVSVDYSIDAGSAMIRGCEDPPVTCAVTSSSNVLCNGGNTGSIQVSVVNASTDCDCVWYKDGSTTPFITLKAPNCSLVNVGAGMYRLSVMCGDEEVCTSMQTITQPNAITINGAVTNIGCTQTVGTIVLSVTGGTPNFTYKWNDPPMSTSKDITNLSAGTYTVTVTDNNMCTLTRTFTITDMVPDLVVTETVTHVSCRGGNTGSIALNITGGCTDGGGNYSVSPTNLTNLTAGVYSITVTDFSTPSMVVVKDITITEPAEVLSVDGTTTPSTGSDGTITITPKGGTPTYTIVWTGGIPAGTTNATGLPPGSYTVTITDSKGCTTSKTFIVTEEEDDVAIGPINSTGANCKGNKDGTVTGTVTAGQGPFTIELLSGTTVVGSTTIATKGVWSITGVGRGNYTIRVTDSNGTTASGTATVSEPTAISLDTEITCANGNSDDGSISLSVSGGTPDYTFEWSNGEVTQDIADLAIGTYSVVIQDSKGCQAILNNLRVADCSPSDCYEAITIITPNSDGINDLFVINCVMQEESVLTIYDRWGREVYTQQNYDNTWGGLDLAGDELPESAYMWVLDVNFASGRREVFKGTVTVLRDNR